MQYNKTVILKTGEPCTIRTAEGADAAGVLRCFLGTHEETDNMLTLPEECTMTEEDERAFLEKRAQQTDGAELCAVVNGEIAGTAGFDPVGRHIKIRHRASFGIGILRDYWNRGIGRALTTACIALAKEAGYRQLELDVVADNAAAIALYESCGFAEYGRNPLGFCIPGRGDQTQVLMRLELE